jgi:hypothetical protein
MDNVQHSDSCNEPTIADHEITQGSVADRTKARAATTHHIDKRIAVRNTGTHITVIDVTWHAYSSYDDWSTLVLQLAHVSSPCAHIPTPIQVKSLKL